MVRRRPQSLVYGSILALIIGWVLYVGRDVFVPIVLSAIVVYVIVGLTRLLGKIPWLGPRMPGRMRSALSVAISLFGLGVIAYVMLDNLDKVIALTPRYQGSLLVAIQRVAVQLGIQDEPTWGTLRSVFLERVNVQALIGSAVSLATSIVASLIVVLLYVAFLLLEQRVLADKIDNIAATPDRAALIRQIIVDTNSRIGSYLAVKSFLGLLLAVISWAIMRMFHLELAAFWAMLILLLNYVPYIGSFLSVLLPVALAVAQFGDFGTVLTLLLALTAVQFVIGNFLDPYLLGTSLNLSPFAILASLSIWSALWGIPGAFLAVPITAIMTIVFSEFAGTRPIAILLSQSGKLE